MYIVNTCKICLFNRGLENFFVLNKTKRKLANHRLRCLLIVVDALFIPKQN